MIRIAAMIGGRICWLIVCIYIASGLVSYASRWPAKVVAVVPQPGGIRVVTEGGRRGGRPAQQWPASIALGLAAWGGLFYVRAARPCWTGVLALGLVGSFAFGTEPYRRMKLRQELEAVPDAKVGAYKKLFFQRGVSYIGDGFEAYHPKPTGIMFDALKQYGVDSVAVVPYGTYRQGSTEVGFGWQGTDAELYVAMMKVAHGRGIRVLLKPQLWVTPGMFPGSIRIDEEDKRTAWFASYSRFILHWAKVAERGHADLFAVGTELQNLSGYETEWKEIVAQVRRIYGGPITYAANQGPDFEKLAWWDCLDYIGLNEYYPLKDDLNFSGVISRVEAVQKKFGKPVILTEVGFASVDGSHREPWSEPARPADFMHQRRCYEALMAAFWKQPWFYGMYPWKVSAHGNVGPDDASLTPWKKPAMEVLRSYYLSRR